LLILIAPGRSQLRYGTGAAVRLRKIISNEWLLVLAGIASIVFRVLLLIQPAVRRARPDLVDRRWAIVSGVLFMILAFRIAELERV